MKLFPMKKLLNEIDNRAVPAINVSNMESIMALLEVSERLKAPVIIQVAPIQLETQQLSYQKFVDMVCLLGEGKEIHASIHLDHATDIHACFKAIDAGFNSVMYDGSHLDYEANIKNSKIVADYASKYNVTVEAELGRVGGSEGEVSGKTAFLTDPEKVEAFVLRTNVDVLAVSIGNAHGIYPFEPKLEFGLLESIKGRASIPLVLHGGTGLSEQDLKMAIAKGIRKINFFTEIDRAFMKGVIKAYESNNHIYMMSALEQGRQAMMKSIETKFNLCGYGRL